MNSDQAFLEFLQKMGTQQLLDPAVSFPVSEHTEVEEEDDSGDEGKAVVQDSSPSGGVTPGNFLRHPETHPILLDLALIKKYEIDWMEWEVETLEVHILQDFATSSVSDLNLSKVEAMKTLHLVDTFWKQWEVFLWVTMPLSGMFPDFEVMQVPTLGQCVLSVDIAARVRSDVQWSEELKEYLAVVHRHEGVLCPVPPLDFVTVETEGFPIDVVEIRELWPGVRDSRKAPKEETVTAEQLRRMLDMHEYLVETHRLLVNQMPILKHV